MEQNIRMKSQPLGTLTWRMLNRPVVRLVLGVVAAIILIYTFSRLVSFGSVLQRLEHLNLWLAALCGAVFLCAYAVRALRWRRFLAPYPVSRWRVILIYQVATFVNWLLPVRGGELVKGLLLRQLDGVPMSESLPTVAMDKLMDLLPAVVLVLALPFVSIHLSQPLWALLSFVLVVIVVGAAFLALAAWRRRLALALLARLLGTLPAGLRTRIEPFTLRFLDALLALVARPRVLLVTAAYTVVAVILDATFALLAFAAIGTRVAFPHVLFGYTLYNLAYILPTPPGQIGSNEVIGLLVFSGLFGINRTAVAAMFVFSHPWTALLMTISGLLSLSALGVTFRSVLGMARPQIEAPVPPSAPAAPHHIGATVAPTEATAPSAAMPPAAVPARADRSDRAPSSLPAFTPMEQSVAPSLAAPTAQTVESALLTPTQRAIRPRSLDHVTPATPAARQSRPDDMLLALALVAGGVVILTSLWGIAVWRRRA